MSIHFVGDNALLGSYESYKCDPIFDFAVHIYEKLLLLLLIALENHDSWISTIEEKLVMEANVTMFQVPYYLAELIEKIAEDERIKVVKASQLKLKVKL